MADMNSLRSQNEYSELLYAYSLGCLDKDELLLLEEYFQTGGDFPWQELGEYQNLAALLPSILNMETPGPELKDKVARKLYRIKNERRPKKADSKTHSQPVSPDKQPQSQAEKAGLSDYLEQSRSTALNVQETEHLNESEKAEGGFAAVEESFTPEPENQMQHGNEIDTSPNPDEIDTLGIDVELASAATELEAKKEEPTSYRLHGISEPEKKTGGKKKSFAGIIIFFIIVLLGVAAYFFIYQKLSLDVNKSKTQVNILNKQVADLSARLNVNKEVDRILQMKDAHIVNLFSTVMGKEATGKVIISFDSSSGFLQVSDLPALANDKYYQLWINANKTIVSLGTFRPSENISYFPISLPSQNYKGDIKFLLTEESSADAASPSSKLYLAGVLK